MDHLERSLALVAPGGMQLKLTGNSSGLSVRVWPGKRFMVWPRQWMSFSILLQSLPVQALWESY